MKVYIQILVLVLMCSCFVQAASSAKPARKEGAVADVKYPNLEKLKTAFWDNFEAINNGNESSKLVARDTRNMLSTVLGEPLFWQLATDAMVKQVKYTHDKRKADVKVRLCNLVTDTLTSRGMADGLLRLADDAYETAVRANTDVAEDALHLATDAVNGGRVTAALDSASALVGGVTLQPAAVHKLFDLSRKYVDTCGLIEVSDGMAKRLVNSMNKYQGKAQQPPQRATSMGGSNRSGSQRPQNFERSRSST